MDRSPRAEPARSAHLREDREANLRLVEALAPIHCTDCNGYHLDRARRRLHAPAALDRPEIVRLLRDWLADPRRAGGAVDVLIAGSGDTNLLATCAEAAAAEHAWVRYTVLDRCQTPLELCAEFARRNGLDAQIHRIDMAAPQGVFAADVIVVHSLLRFLPGEAHLLAMRALRRWLKPGGVVIFSHRLIDGSADATSPIHRAEYGSIDPLRRLLAEAGLRIEALQEHLEDVVPGGGKRPRHRALAVLRAADE
jgi:SAM-dependent methyltransferase